MEIWDTVLRSLLAFTVMMVIARILGKATIAQMTYHDFVASITLGSITANMAFNNTISIWILLAASFSFAGIAFALMFFAMKNRKLRAWFSGQPTVLIQDGKILENNMKKLKITLDTLNQELRGREIFNIEEVQYAVLELNGTVSVMRTPESMPVTRRDLQLTQNAKQSFPIELIMDGKLIEANLEQNNISEKWLYSQIKLKGLSSDNINYAVLSTNGSLYLDELNDRISNPIDME